MVEFDVFGSEYLGGCFGYLVCCVEEGCKVKVFSEYNDNFCLLVNDEMLIIMVGLGMGIVLFCVFL